MKRIVLLLAALPAALLAGKSDPGAPFVAVERELERTVQRDGVWTAFRAYAMPQTELLVPQRVKALEFGAGMANPREITRRQTEHVWVSCDGTIGVTTGRWWWIELPKGNGWYEAIWAKLSDGTYRILLTHAGPQTRQLYSHPGRRGQRAACGGEPPPLPIVAPDVGTDFKLGASHDQTLIWSSSVSAEGRVRIVISLWNGKTFDPVLEDVAPAPAPR